jgi:hypothetical protein
LGLAVHGYAIAGRCLELALEWARRRETFGRKLAQRQVIRHKLAEMARRADVAREYTPAVARRLQAGEDVTLQVSMAKNTAVEACGFSRLRLRWRWASSEPRPVRARPSSSANPANFSTTRSESPTAGSR